LGEPRLPRSPHRSATVLRALPMFFSPTLHIILFLAPMFHFTHLILISHYTPHITHTPLNFIVHFLPLFWIIHHRFSHTFFAKITKILKFETPKILFFPFPSSVCSATRVVWHWFSNNSKFLKKNIKISSFSTKKSFLRTVSSLILQCEIHRTKASLSQVHLQKIKSFSK